MAAMTQSSTPHVSEPSRDDVALPMTITPFVFALEAGFEPVLNHEVAALFWLPFDDAVAGSLDDQHEYRLGPLPMKFPCWRFEGRPVWGLTYQMLRTLSRLESP